MSETVTAPLGVRQVDLTKKSNLLIQQATKIATQLITTILVDTVWVKTFGKAYIIDQKAISKEYTMSTVLQETEDGQLIALETVHPANENVAKQFERKRRTTKDFGITLYPMYVALGVLSILYSVLIYRTGIKKLPIIIESSQWFDLFLITVIFLIIEGFLYYWISTQYIEVTIFRSYTRAKTKTYEVRFDGQLKSITAVKFHGMFFSLETTTAKKLFGHSPGEIEEYLTDAKGNSFIQTLTHLYSKKIGIEQRLIDAYRIFEIKKYELENVEASFTREKSESDDLVELETQKENDSTVKEKTEEVAQSKTYYEGLDTELMPEREELIKEINEVEVKYLAAINEIMGAAKKSKARELLTNSEKLISSLTHENSLLKAKTIRLTNMLQGAYEEGLVRSDEIRENVYSLVQEEGAKKYEISYTLKNQNGTETFVPSGGPGSQQQEMNNKGSGVSLDMTPLLKIVIGVGAIVVIIYAMGWLTTTVIAQFGGLTPLAVIGMFLFLLIIIIAGMYIFRGLSKYDSMMSSSDSSIKLN